jgi:pyrimidine-nucleoside phosphorylase
MLLGAGRAKKGDPIDHAVGVVLRAKIGDYVKRGEPLLTIHANDGNRLAQARERLLAAYTWSEEPVQAPPLLYEIIRDD